VHSFDVAILDECRKRGRHPSEMTEAEFTAIALGVRSGLDKGVAIAARVTSEVRRVVGASVPREVADVRLAVCQSNACGKYATIASGEGACLACGCAGHGLMTKVLDASEACPDSPPRWTEHN